MYIKCWKGSLLAVASCSVIEVAIESQQHIIRAGEQTRDVYSYQLVHASL